MTRSTKQKRKENYCIFASCENGKDKQKMKTKDMLDQEEEKNYGGDSQQSQLMQKS